MSKPSNPFEAPRTQPAERSGVPGEVDIATALSDGWESMIREIGPWLLALLVYATSAAFATVACFFPVLVVAPLMMLGGASFTLSVVDGKADLERMWGAFSDPIPNLMSAWGYIGVQMILMIPALIFIGIATAVQIVVADSSPGLSMLVGLGSQVFYTAYMVMLLSRLWPCLFLIVDRRMGVVDAYVEAWNRTSSAWPTMLGLMFITSIVLPIVGIMFCIVGSIPASFIAYGALGSAYRQLMSEPRRG